MADYFITSVINGRIDYHFIQGETDFDAAEKLAANLCLESGISKEDIEKFYVCDLNSTTKIYGDML